MFLHMSVILFTGGISRPTPSGEVEGSGWGSLEAHTQEEVEGSGWGESPGPNLGEVEGSGCGGFQAHTWGVSQHALRQTPQEMATAVDGTNATGMHSCSYLYLHLITNIIS